MTVKESSIAKMIPGRGSIDGPNPEAQPGEGWVRPPKPSQQERAAEIRQQHATLAKATASAEVGLSRYQVAALKAWWEIYHGEAPAADVTPEMMAELFLRAPARWAKNAPLGLMTMRPGSSAVGLHHEDEDDTLDEFTEYKIGIDVSESAVNRLVAKRKAVMLPCLTIRVLAASWPFPFGAAIIPPQFNAVNQAEHDRLVREFASSFTSGVRGQLLLLAGTRSDRRIQQGLELGLIDVVSEGRYKGELEHLGTCPSPEARNPDGRAIVQTYIPAHGLPTDQIVSARNPDPIPPTPRTIDALLPNPPKHIRNPAWHETPMIEGKANFTDSIAGFEFKDQEVTRTVEWLGAVLNVRKNQRGEPMWEPMRDFSEPTQRFRAAVEAFTAANPGAKTDHENFPVYCVA